MKGWRMTALGVFIALAPFLVDTLTSLQTGVAPLYSAALGVLIIAIRFFQTAKLDGAAWTQLALGLGVALVPGVLVLLNVVRETPGLPPWLALSAGVAVTLLQLVTNTPVGKKETPS